MPANLVKKEENSYTLDVCGYTCPYPEFYTGATLDKLTSGQTLEVILDNPPSCEAIPTAAKKRQGDVLEVSKISDTAWRIVIKKQ
jgi:tRNA 2-thiouridine synthesizing protein A